MQQGMQGAAGKAGYKYAQDYESTRAMPKPTDPNEFIAWLWNSGILSEYDKDLIRARFEDPTAQTPMGASTEQPQNVTGQQPTAKPAGPAV